MKEFDPKVYLNQIKYIDEDIESRQEEVRRMKERLYMKTSTVKESVIQESRVGHFDDKYERVLSAMEQINHRIDELVDLKVRVTNEIDLLEDNRHRIILRERYLNMRRWEDIADYMHYEIRQVHRLHGEALLAFLDVIECHKVT